MAEGTSSAEPDRLVAYGAAVQPLDEALATATSKFVATMESFFAGAGEFAPTGSAEDWAAPLGRVHDGSSYLAGWVVTVGKAFHEAVADLDDDGVYDIRDASLGARVGLPILAEERAWVAEQLRTLNERAADGTLDAGVTAELLARARRLVTSADDPGAEAEQLVAAIGARDLEAALGVLSPAAGDATGVDDPAVVGLRDLGHVLSLGLEDQPSRANRWIDDIVERNTVIGDLPDELAEGLALTGAGNAPGTAAFGTALVAGVLAGPGETTLLGPVHRLYGTRDPLAPIMTTAASRRSDGSFTQAPLAHAIVTPAVNEGIGTATQPMLDGRLDRLGAVYREVSTTVGNERFQSLVDTVEDDGNRLQSATTSLVTGVMGEVPGGSTAAGATEALMILTEDQPDVTGGASALNGLRPNLTRNLVAFNLMANPELATEGVLDTLRQATAPGAEHTLDTIMHDDSSPVETPGDQALNQLQRLVHEQEETIGLDVALAVDDLTAETD